MSRLPAADEDQREDKESTSSEKLNSSANSLPLISNDENEPLSVQNVLQYFQLVSNPERTISVPPIRPKGGEVYLYVPESPAPISKSCLSC